MSKAVLLTFIVIAVLLLAAGKWIADGLEGIAHHRPGRPRFA